MLNVCGGVHVMTLRFPPAIIQNNESSKAEEQTLMKKIPELFPVMSDATSAIPLPCLSPPVWPLPSKLITHHCKGHELQDAPTTSLLQTLNTLLHKALHELGVRSGHLGAEDGGNEEKKVGWRGENRW